MISVICPVLNEEKYIASCIQSIADQNYSHDQLELIVCDGLSTDKTREIVQELAKSFSWLKLIENPERVVPTALNRAIRAAKGDVIVRIDGHAQYPPEYLAELESNLIRLGADNVGGVWNTLPANNSYMALAIAEVSKNPFGIGNAVYRLGTAHIQKVDTVPFGCFPRSLFDRIGLFDEELIRNQDDEFNARILKNGGSIYILPELKIDYYARGTLAKFCRMFYQYGLFKPMVNQKVGYPATIRQLVPLAFCLSLIVLLCAGFFLPLAWLGLLVILFTHFAVGALFGFMYASRPKLIPLMLVVFVSIHFSYGIGYIKGIFNLIFSRKESVSITR